jgi:peptidoglycan/LPS O-acetylase OafA/YrhL
MIRAEPSRLPFLDTARGLAALSVITWHCFTAIIDHPESSKLYTTPFHFFLYGEADMIFFFVHSGFILSYSHAQFQNEFSGISYLKYLIKRISRIYPVFLFILFLSFLLKKTIYPIPATNYLSAHFLKFWNNPIQLKEVLQQGLLAVRIPDNANLRLIPQDWTLTIEVLICPLIPFINFLNRKSKVFCWLLVLLVLKVFHFNTFLFEFVIGVNLYSFRHQIAAVWNKSHWSVKLIVLLFGILLYTCFFSFPDIFNQETIFFSPAMDRLMVVSGCAIFFIFILNSDYIQSMFNRPLFVKIGKICYSLYLNHIFLLICFSNIFLSLLHRFLKGPEWLIILSFVLFFQMLTIAVSLVTYRFVEKPFNKWGRQASIFISNHITAKFQKHIPPAS